VTQGAGALAGKVAVVTGGSRGLGREMALAFAEAGASVVVASRKVSACDALAEELEQRFGTKALGVGFHAGRWSDCERLVEATLERFGRIDVLVNNAGMSPLYPSLDQVSEALYDKVLEVNLRGPFRLASVIGSRMAAGEGGSIINVSSVAAVQPGQAGGAQTAETKRAAEGAAARRRGGESEQICDRSRT